jgi:hypothetical protein
MSGNEASAIGSLRALNSAQQTYASACAGGNYAGAWGLLAPAVGQAYLSPDLTTAPNRKSGYQFALAAGQNAQAGAADCNAQNGTQSTYYASGVPVTPGSTGGRAFATNQAGTIWQDTANQGAAAPAEPFAIAGTIAPIQ